MHGVCSLLIADLSDFVWLVLKVEGAMYLTEMVKATLWLIV